jgi:hypothetical protein
LNPDIIYNPEIKERRHTGTPSPKKLKTQNSLSKVLASVFWDKDGILLVNHLEKGATIIAKYYVAILNIMKQQLVSKRQSKFSKGIPFLHKVLIMHQKWEDPHFEVVKHINLAPSYYLSHPQGPPQGKTVTVLEQ